MAGVGQRGGGDGVEPRADRTHHVQEDRERQLDRPEALQQAQHGDTLAQDLSLIALLGFGGVGRVGLKLRSGPRALRVLSQRLHLGAGGHVLQLQEIGEQQSCRHRGAHREVGAAAGGQLQAQDLIAVDAERREGTVHQGRFVLGEDGQVVAGLVGDTLRQADGDGLRRRARRLEAEVPQAGGVGHEFLVGHHREGVGLLGDDRGAHVRLGEQLHLEARAAHLGGVGGVLLGQGGPQGFHPAAGHAVEVTGGIRGAALDDGGGAGGQQAFFDPLGEALVSGHPLGVAGPQQCEPHVRQRTLRESGSEQVVETLRVVRGLAVVAGGHHDKQALGGQVVAQLVQTDQRGAEAGALTAVGDGARQVLARAEAGAVGDGQVHPDTADCGLRRRVAGLQVHCAEHGPLVLLTGPHFQFEAAGLARQRLLDVHLVVVGVGELELLQHQREGQAGLGERKLPADTGTHAVAERLVGVRVVVDPVLRQPPVDVELLRPVPRLGVGVQRALEDVDPRSLLQFVAAADDGVLQRGLADHRDGSPQAQGFLEDARDYVHLHDRVVVRDRVARKQAVHLCVGLGQYVRVAHQRVRGERQQTTGGLVTGDQERHYLVTDVVVVQPLAGLRVGGLQHQTQQVILCSALPLTALPDHTLDQVPHLLDVRAVLLVIGLAQFGHHRQLLRAPQRLNQRLQQRVEEGVQILLGERVEPVTEPRQGDGVQGQPSVVVGDVDRLALPALPLAHQVLGYLQHLPVVALHRPLAEGREKDSVRHAPFLLVLVGREQAGAREVPDMGQGRLVDLLEEPRLVANLGHQVRVPDEDLFDAGDLHAVEPLGELLGHFAEVLHRVGAGDLRRVAEERDRARRPDGSRFVLELSGHGFAPLCRAWMGCCVGDVGDAPQKHTLYGIATIHRTEGRSQPGMSSGFIPPHGRGYFHTLYEFDSVRVWKKRRVPRGGPGKERCL
ncbi:hypothetical protein SRABI26_03554 [Arthrobacter sp. Bi26]|nr:hypothetical protein SRABI26_03554 [Arthrobacter sp. Bi26]